MKIVIVDDDFLICTALKTILEADSNVQVVATGSNGLEALQLYETLQPDILLMDIRMEKMNGLEAASKILARYEKAKILLLTTFLDDEYIIKALKIGAKGYLLKQDYQSIAPALNAVALGQTVFGQEIIEKIPNLLQPKKSFDYTTFGMNDREFEVMSLVADGLSNKEIASQLYLSEGTVRNYISGILDKMQLRDRTQLAVFFYQHL